MQTVTAEPLFILDAVSLNLNKRINKFVDWVGTHVSTPEDLARIDFSGAYVAQTIAERVSKYTRQDYFSESTWNAILAASRARTFDKIVSEKWLLADIEEYITEVVRPAVNKESYDISVPEEADERGTEYDEYLIHALAVVNSITALIKGVSFSVQGYGKPEQVVSRLIEYFELQMKKGEEFPAYHWEDESGGIS